jgi:CheY-like chemotaxis protein
METMPQKLLLADDSVTIQRVIELTFADEDVQVTAVGDGQAAIDHVQRDRPDIVLADVGMPERNGYEVAAFVKGNPATAHIPVVLLTGAFEPIDEGRAREVGCDGVLVKPFEPQLVISRVKDLLAGRKPAGMWSAAPVAQGPVRPSAADLELRSGGRQAAAAADPLEAYFDRLDAAFASSGPGAAPADPFANAPSSAPAASTDPFAGSAPAPTRESIPLARRPEPAVPPPSARSKEDDPFASWDPDLAGDPARPAPPAAAAPPVAPPRAVAPPVQPPAPPAPASPVTPAAAAPRPAPPAPAPGPAPAPVTPAPPAAAAPAAPPPSLVDAFAALLAAEQRIGLKPSAAATPSSAAPAAPASLKISDEMIEEVTARVLVRLTDASRPTILDVAERLVREEIERIKQSGR